MDSLVPFFFDKWFFGILIHVFLRLFKIDLLSRGTNLVASVVILYLASIYCFLEYDRFIIDPTGYKTGVEHRQNVFLSSVFT